MEKKLKVEKDLRRREREEKQKQEQEERQGALIEKIVPIHVETIEQQVDEEEGELVQVPKLTKQVEKMVEAIDMETKQEPHD